MKTIAQLLKHDFKSKGPLFLYDSNRNLIYFENSERWWEKYEYNSNGNTIYYENSDECWKKREYDLNGNRIYYEDSDGTIIGNCYLYRVRSILNNRIIGNRPKESCNGKVVEIDGKKYKLTEV